MFCSVKFCRLPKDNSPDHRELIEKRWIHFSLIPAPGSSALLRCTHLLPWFLVPVVSLPHICLFQVYLLYNILLARCSGQSCEVQRVSWTSPQPHLATWIWPYTFWVQRWTTFLALLLMQKYIAEMANFTSGQLCLKQNIKFIGPCQKHTPEPARHLYSFVTKSVKYSIEQNGFFLLPNYFIVCHLFKSYSESNHLFALRAFCINLAEN